MPDQRHASSMLTPDFDTYPARPIASIDVHPLGLEVRYKDCLLYTSPSPRDGLLSRMPSSA